MKIIPGNAQHQGDRENQQDSFGFSDFSDHAFARHGGFMMVLCDGMGGLAKGATASRVAVDTILGAYHRKEPSETIAAALERSVAEAQRAVREIPSDGESAGTTAVAAVVCQAQLYWISVGDSRLYLCRPGAAASQLTEDHNIVTDLRRRAARGEISDKEASTAANPEALTNYLGTPEPTSPDVRRDGMRLQVGDRVVACSDGLYRGISRETLVVAAHRGNPMTAAQGMVELVLDKRLKHQDNITVVMLEVAAGGVPWWKPVTVAQGAVAGAVCASVATFLFTLGLNWLGILNVSAARQPLAAAAVNNAPVQPAPPSAPGPPAVALAPPAPAPAPEQLAPVQAALPTTPPVAAPAPQAPAAVPAPAPQAPTAVPAPQAPAAVPAPAPQAPAAVPAPAPQAPAAAPAPAVEPPSAHLTPQSDNTKPGPPLPLPPPPPPQRPPANALKNGASR
jgi:PPM family protein phosphatase